VRSSDIPAVTYNWKLGQLPISTRYSCAWCGHTVSSQHGVKASDFYTQVIDDDLQRIAINAVIAICPDCSRPTFIEDDVRGYFSQQLPNAPLGSAVQHLPSEIAALYEEARHCTTVEAYTSAVLLARKILLHVAVKEGASANINFQQAVNYLDEHHFIPRNGKGWVDRIRKLGNEANHEIVVMTRDQAEETLTFTGWLLTLTYQLPGSLPPPAPSTS
jgi:hypothetical protein